MKKMMLLAAALMAAAVSCAYAQEDLTKNPATQSSLQWLENAVPNADAEAATEQLSLFDLMGQGASRQKRERLEAAVEDLRKKYGDGSVTLGIQENADIGLRRRS